MLDSRRACPYGINNAGPTSGVLGAGYAGAVGPFYSGVAGSQLSEPAVDDAARDPAIRAGRQPEPDLHREGRADAKSRCSPTTSPFRSARSWASWRSRRDRRRSGEPGVTVPGVQSSTPPGVLRRQHGREGSDGRQHAVSPVFHPGALFYTGDPHSAQGDGEVSGTAIEHSLTGMFRFTLHKGKTIHGSARRRRQPLHHDGDRSRPRSGDATCGSGGREFLVTEKGLAPRLRLLAGEHRRRLPRRRSGGPDADRDRQDSEVDFQEIKGR